MLVVDALAETRGVDDSEGDAHTVLLKLNVDGLDLDLTLNVGVGSGLLGEAGVNLGARVLGVLQDLLGAVGKHRLLNQRVNEGGAASTRGTWDVSVRPRVRSVLWEAKPEEDGVVPASAKDGLCACARSGLCASTRARCVRSGAFTACLRRDETVAGWCVVAW